MDVLPTEPQRRRFRERATAEFKCAPDTRAHLGQRIDVARPVISDPRPSRQIPTREHAERGLTRARNHANLRSPRCLGHQTLKGVRSNGIVAVHREEVWQRLQNPEAA